MVSGKKKQLKGSSYNNDNNMDTVLGEEDRISELSDPLLLHILSSLPTKCAISTSILSKRWRYVWNSSPILDFRDWRSHNIKESSGFTRFMDKLLAPHGGMPNIQEFYLDFDENMSVARLNSWISTLVQHKVEKLHLFIEDRIRSFILPPCLFNFESLTMLKLRMGNVLKLPESISFPKLKILRLKHIDFVDEKLTHLFFSNCPLLEELIITDCSWSMNFVCISAPALKYLSFRYHGKQKKGFLANCVVKIYAPNLLSLGYRECVAREYVLCSFSSVVDANIDLLREDYWASREQNRVMGYAANKLVQKLSNVKLLKMSCDTFELLSFADDLITNLPTFHNLIHLEVTSSSRHSIIKIIFDFLQITPNIEKLVFDEDPRKFDDVDSWTLNVVPQCLLLHLKTVEFRTYRSLTHSSRLITWVKLFLKHAAVLQRMTIITSSFSLGNSLIQKELMEEIEMSPRASTDCVVEFLDLENI